MKKVNIKRILFIMVVMLFIGLILIMYSTKIGKKIGYNAIQKNGGSMDASSYEMIIETSTSNFHTGGLVLSLVGGLGSLLSGYALYNQL